MLTVETAAITFGLSGARVAAMYLCAEEYGRRRLDGVRSALAHCLCFGAVCSRADRGSPPVRERMDRGYVAARAAGFGLPAHHGARPAPALLCRDPLRLLHSLRPGSAAARARRRDRAPRLSRAHDVPCLLSPETADGDVCRPAGQHFTEAAACAALGVMICRDLRGHSPRAGLHMGQRMAKLCLPLAASDYLRSGLRTIEQFLIPWGLMRAGGSYEAAMTEYGMFGGMVFPVLMFPAAFLYALSDLLVPELARSRAEGDTSACST